MRPALIRSRQIPTPALVVAAGCLLAGCAGLGQSRQPPPPQPDPNMTPANYKSDILSFLQARLPDPASVRDAYLAPPMLKRAGDADRWVVCVRYDAKSTYGRYLGTKDHAAIYLGGRINQFVEAAGDQCAGVDYQSFPELMALKKP
jgi:hypothetical protein